MEANGSNNTLIIDDHCFACGKENVAGLNLRIGKIREETADGIVTKAVCDFVADIRFQGYGGVIHGGILSTLLDELMIYALFFEHIPTVTAKIEVAFKQRVYAGETLTGEARMTRDRGRMLQAEACLRNARGEVVARASGLFARAGAVVRK